MRVEGFKWKGGNGDDKGNENVYLTGLPRSRNGRSLAFEYE